MADRDGTRARSARRGAGLRVRHALWMLLGACLVLALGLAWTWVAPRARLAFDLAFASMADVVPDASAASLFRLGRLASTTYFDAEETWQRYFAGRTAMLGRTPDLVLFSRVMATPCVFASGATGPFYCAQTRSVVTDVDFLEALERRMRKQSGQAVPLAVARFPAQRVQDVGDGRHAPRRGDALAAALQTDCLTGVYARLTRDRIGAVPDGLYARLIEASRLVTRERVLEGRSGDAQLFEGALADRETAFRLGRDGADAAGCLALLAVPAEPG